jgi:signal transduction histidine kinase
MDEMSGPTAAPEPVRKIMGVGTSAAHVAVVAASLFGIHDAPLEPGARAVALAAAVLSLVLGIPGLYACERRGTRRTLHAYFAAQTLLGLTVLVASRGAGGLMLLALVSQAILYLSAVPAVAFAVGTFVAVPLVWSAHHPELTVGGIVNYGSAVAFVSMFSYLALRQHQARAATQRLAAELAEANDRLRRHADEIEELATLRERNRIAREIHDTLGHSLTVVHVQLDAARRLLATNPEGALGAIDRAQRMTHEGLGEVRRSVSMLRGASLTAGPLVPALEKLVTDTRETGLETRLEVLGTPRKLAPATEFTLYRAMQEALTNARRHARATRVVASVNFGDEAFVALHVEDDGLGADDEPMGFGLLGLRERVQALGGRVAVETTKASGFALRVEVPG